MWAKGLEAQKVEKAHRCRHWKTPEMGAGGRRTLGKTGLGLRGEGHCPPPATWSVILGLWVPPSHPGLRQHYCSLDDLCGPPLPPTQEATLTPTGSGGRCISTSQLAEGAMPTHPPALPRCQSLLAKGTGVSGARWPPRGHPVPPALFPSEALQPCQYSLSLHTPQHLHPPSLIPQPESPTCILALHPSTPCTLNLTHLHPQPCRPASPTCTPLHPQPHPLHCPPAPPQTLPLLHHPLAPCATLNFISLYCPPASPAAPNFSPLLHSLHIPTPCTSAPSNPALAAAASSSP